MAKTVLAQGDGRVPLGPPGLTPWRPGGQGPPPPPPPPRPSPPGPPPPGGGGPPPPPAAPPRRPPPPLRPFSPPPAPSPRSAPPFPDSLLPVAFCIFSPPRPSPVPPAAGWLASSISRPSPA